LRGSVYYRRRKSKQKENEMIKDMKDTAKCPQCRSRQVIKKGKRKGPFGITQMYRCKTCGRSFGEKPLKNTKYPARVIFQALNLYNQGHTLEETSRSLNKQFKLKTGKTTVHSWIQRYQDLCPIVSLRDNFKKNRAVVFSKQFEHENLDYLFMYHDYKLRVFAQRRFPGLVSYIERFEQGCPDEFFEVGKRCSQPLFQVSVKPKKKVNLACRMSRFAILPRQSNRDRHTLVEQFMLINDTATIASEVPVWYWEKSVDSGVTGHIDLLQVRGGKVYILDYKPGASQEKKAPQQLYHYAAALSFRAKVPFESIRCAWFDENAYFEFSPSDAVAKLIK